MPLQGPFVVVADSPAPDVVEALRAAGASPVVETNWADAVAALATVEPEAIVLAQPCSEPERAEDYAQAIAERLDTCEGPFTPIIARVRDDGAAPLPDALTISASAPAERIARRLATLSRIRALHGTVLRRMETLASRNERDPAVSGQRPA